MSSGCIAAGMESDESDSDYDTLCDSALERKSKKSEPEFIALSAEYVRANGLFNPPPESPQDVPEQNNSKAISQQLSIKKKGYSPVTHKKEPLDDLRYAVVHGNLDVTKSIIEGGIAPDCILKSGWSGLMYACSSAHDSIVEYLLYKGANSNFNKDSFTPLMAVCASTKEGPTLLRCCQLLLKYNAKVNVHERHLTTPLMFAAREGHFDIIKELLNAGAEINAQDNRGRSALMWAACHGYGQIVRLFIENGANLNDCDSFGQTAADLALEHDYKEITSLLEKKCGDSNIQNELNDEENQNKKLQSRMFPNTSRQHQNFKCYSKHDELEIFLKGLGLSDLITIIKEQKLTFRQLTVLSDEELEKIGITELGVRKKILEASLAVQKERWKRSSLPNVRQLPYISCPDAVAMIANIDEHLEHISSQIVYIRLQIQAEPKILELAQDSANVHNLIEETETGLKNVKTLYDELRFLKLYLNKIQGNNEFEPADLIDESSTSPYHSYKTKVAFGFFIVTVTIGGILWKKPDSISNINSFFSSKIAVIKDFL